MAASGEQGARRRASLARKAHGLAVREGLFPAGARVLVMVSGGQDSLALLHILAEFAGRPGGPAAIHAFHVNHHLRGQESDDDEALVIRACGAIGVDVTVDHQAISKKGGNVQERAREARRGAALRAAIDLACDRIALGHTADDQAETMLYRLGRYGGLAAFRAMLPCDPPWVRPLLECRREETAAHCRQHGLAFAQDRGNAYPGYARTGLREKVLPAWEAALPGAVDAAARAAAVAAELEQLADSVLDQVEPRVVLAAGAPGALSNAALSVRGLLALEPAVRRLLLHRWLERRARPAASRAAVLAVEALLSVAGSAQRNLGGGWRAVKEYDALRLESGPKAAPVAVPAPVGLSIPGCVEWAGHRVCAEPAARYLAPDIWREAFVDAACLAGEVVVRGPQPGDRVRPLGAPGTRKLQDVLVDLRVPTTGRSTTPLVTCDGRVVWVGGLLVAEEGRITGATTAMVRLSVSRTPGGEPQDPAGAREGDGQ